MTNNTYCGRALSRFRWRALSFVLGILVCTSASSVPDALAIPLEPGLEADDHLGNPMGWLDDRTLLVTAQAAGEFWDRKVVRVDVATSEVKELINPGALTCASSREKIFSAFVGSAAGLFSGRAATQPKPELRSFSWSPSRGLQELGKSGADWNPYICKRTGQSDINVPAFGFLERYVRYLDAPDGYIRFPRGLVAGPVELIKRDTPVAAIRATPFEIALVPQYLSSRGVYVLSAGQFVMSGTMVRANEAPTTEYPLVTMTKQGEVGREYFRPLFERSGLLVDGQAIPYAKGTLVMAQTRPRDGGGIYLHEGDSLKRVWCTGNGNHYDRQCRFTDVSMSPDGCHIAFFEQGSDNPRARYSPRPTLKVLSLCS
jgi:hypothetical protein